MCSYICVHEGNNESQWMTDEVIALCPISRHYLRSRSNRPFLHRWEMHRNHRAARNFHTVRSSRLFLLRTTIPAQCRTLLWPWLPNIAARAHASLINHCWLPPAPHTTPPSTSPPRRPERRVGPLPHLVRLWEQAEGRAVKWNRGWWKERDRHWWRTSERRSLTSPTVKTLMTQWRMRMKMTFQTTVSQVSVKFNHSEHIFIEVMLWFFAAVVLKLF